MAWQIVAGMQNINDNDLFGPVQEHQKVLPCPEIAQFFNPIDQD